MLELRNLEEDELKAWDLYFAAAVSADISIEWAAETADEMLLYRRERYVGYGGQKDENY